MDLACSPCFPKRVSPQTIWLLGYFVLSNLFPMYNKSSINENIYLKPRLIRVWVALCAHLELINSPTNNLCRWDPLQANMHAQFTCACAQSYCHMNQVGLTKGYPKQGQKIIDQPNVNLLAKFKYCNTLSSSATIELFLKMSKFQELLLFK